MYWLEVSVVTDGEGAEAVAEAVRPFAYNEGVVLEQLGDTTVAEPDALETAVTVKIYVPEDEDTPILRHRIEEILYYLGRLYPIPLPTFRELEEEDWANAWKAHYHPFRIGNRIWIQPSWLELGSAGPDAGGQRTERVREEDVVLILDPGMAFGTGLHPTTQMCLQALEQWVRPGTRLLDVGTGSGILAIAATKLGAASTLAVDTDEVAVKTAVANAVQNSVDDQIVVRRGSLDSVAEKGWDIVVVNILAPVILNLLEEEALLDYPAENGRLILSGLIGQQRTEVEEAVTSCGGVIAQTYTAGDWATLVVRHRG